MRKAVISILLCILTGCVAFLSARPYDEFFFTSRLDEMYLSEQAQEQFGTRQTALSGNGIYTGAMVETFSFDLEPGVFTFILYGTAEDNAVFELYSPHYTGETGGEGRVFAQTAVSGGSATILKYAGGEIIRGARLRVTRTAVDGDVTVSSISANGGMLYNDSAAIGIIAALVTAAALYFLHRQRGAIAQRDYSSVAVVLCCSLAAVFSTAPILRLALPSGHDVIFHLTRIEGIAEGLRSGQFPVRINPTFLYGYGYADTIMYPPTFLYFPAFLRLLGISPIVSYQIFMLSINTLTAAMSYACFKRLCRRRDLGLFASLAYTLCLYRLICVFTRAAVGELIAIAFAPAVLLGMYTLIFENARRGAGWLTIGYLGIINCHVLSLELSAIFCLVFALVNISRLTEPGRLLALAASAAVVVMTSLWLLIPMLDIGTSGLIVTHYTPTVAEDSVYPSEMFATFVKATGLSGVVGDVNTAMPLTVGGVLGIGMLLFLFFKFFATAKDDEERRLEVLGTGSIKLALAALFVASTLFPWTYIAKLPVIGQILASVQFPWRYFSVASILLVIVLTAAAERLLGLTKKRQLTLFFCAALVVAGSMPYVDAYMQADKSAVLQTKYSRLHVYYIGGQEYLRFGTYKSALDARGSVAQAEGAELTAFSKKYLSVKFNYANAEKDAYVELPLYYYNGYRAAGENGEPLMLGEGDFGVVRVLLPEGGGAVSVEYRPPAYYRAAEVISLISLLAIVSIWIMRRRKIRKEPANGRKIPAADG